METASLPFKQPDHLPPVQTTDSNKITEKFVNGSKTKANASAQGMFNGKTKGKKKIEDIITNLKKVKQVAITSADATSASERQEVDESFASMCTIRTDTPDYTNVTELPPLKKQNPEQHAVKHDNNSLPEKVVPTAKIIQTTSPISNPPTAVRQVILQTVPQKNLPNQQTPIILNKLPPGFIIRNDLPSGSFANLQNTSTSVQPKLLLITKAGGPFFLAQNVNASTIHTQAKPVSKPNSSPAQTRLPASQKGRPPNSNILGSPSKSNTEKPLITVQYNLPYPNNNCKVVNKPINAQKIQNSASVTFQALGNVIKPSKPREMVVNFAGNQTAHITTMPEETSVVSEKKTQFIPSFVYCSPPTTSSIRNKPTTPVREKPKEQTLGVVKSSATVSNANAGKNRNNSGPFHMPQRRSTYDEKIAKLTGKVTNMHQSDRKAKTSSIGLKRKSVVEPNVRVSKRKRQKTEKAKLFEKSKKRKNNDKVASPRRQKTEKMKLNIKVEKEDETYMTSPKAASPGQSMNKSLSKKTEAVPPQTSVGNETNSKKKKEDDNGSLFRDPALLTREERALQRALMMFKELEEKQARKKPKNETDDETSTGNNGNINQLDKTDDVQRKRKISDEGNGESLVKKRKRGLEKQTIEQKTDEKSEKHSEHVQKNSEIVGKMMKEKIHLPIEKTPVHLNESGKREDSLKVVPKKAESTSETVKNTANPAKENKQPKTVKDGSNTPKSSKPATPKTPESAGERHRVKTYMLVPSYHGFKDFSPVVLGSRTRSKKTEPVKTEKEDEVPATKTPEKSEKDIALLVIETVGNKAVKQDVVAKDEEMRDFVKNSLRAQGMLKQDLERTEKDEDAGIFENRGMRHLTVNRNTGETVLHKASRMGYDETVYHCIQQGSDSNAKDNAGWTPLHEACSRGHADVVRVLAKYNADVNACSNDGIRPIHDAADNGNIDSLRMLMAYGADPFISTYSGRSVVDCAKRTEAKEYIKACIGDLYLNDERNNIASVDYENGWEFRGSSSILEKDHKYLGDVFDNLPKQQFNKSAEIEWSETPHLLTYSLPLVKDGVVVGRKNYITLNDLLEALNKPRQNVVRLLKRTKIREMSWMEFSKEVSSSYFNKLSECLTSSNTEEGMVELVPLNWTVRSLLKIKCEQLAL